jgi:uncharacterized protein
MLSIVALPDIHAALHQMRHLKKAFVEADVVVLVGDMTNGRIQDLEELLAIIRQSNTNILAVCGNHDAHGMDKYLEEEGVSIHANHRIIKDVAFLGCGGALPFFSGGYLFNEKDFEAILKQTIEGLNPEIPKILVCHQPPHKTSVDHTHWGLAAGSKAVRKFIEDVQPLICFSGHIHEAHGIGQLGETRLINAGMIEGTNRYAYAEIEDGKVKTLELRKANPQGI